jgi:hypothetical protein
MISKSQLHQQAFSMANYVILFSAFQSLYFLNKKVTKYIAEIFHFFPYISEQITQNLKP